MLRLEPLEDRRMLAAVTVSNNLDVTNGVTTSIAALIANPGADGISLREAILAANATPGADQIGFAPGLSGQTITLNSGMALPTLTDHVTITGAPDLIVAAAVTHVVDVAPGVIVQINDLTLADGFRFGNGGAIANQGRLILTNASIKSSIAVEAHGGGIYNAAGAELQLHNSTIIINAAGAHGGGIYNAGDLLVNNSTISSNNALGGQGGGIHNTGRATVRDSLIAANFASGLTSTAQGGGVYNSSLLDGITLERVTLQGNQAVGADGADGAVGATGSVGDIVDGGQGGPGGTGGNGTNGQAAQGGGLYSSVGYVSLIDSTIESNRAQGGKGGDGGMGGTGGAGAQGITFPIGDDFVRPGGRGGFGGAGGQGGSGGNAWGGGVFVANFTPHTFTWWGLTITDNEARGGQGGAGGKGGTGGAGGHGANGTHAGGTFDISSPPTAGGPGGQGGFGGDANSLGGFAFGGGIFYTSTSAGTLNVENSTIAENRVRGGAGGTGGEGGNGGMGGAGGNGVPIFPNGSPGGVGGNGVEGGMGSDGGNATGGGIRQGSGTLNLRNTTVSSNEAIGGHGGSGGQRAAGGMGGAGGDSAPGGLSGDAGATGLSLGSMMKSGGNGGHANGGGVSATNATANLVNATIASNSATGGNAGIIQSVFVQGGKGEGGGLYVGGAAMATLSHATVSLNHVRGGTHPFSPGSPNGGGIWTADDAGAPTALNHTIVAGNLSTPAGGTAAPSDLFGKPVAAGSAYNLIGTGGAGGLTGGVDGNLVDVADPMLGPLADNGGPTLTMRPLMDSPAIDAGDPLFDPAAANVPFDQRGETRVQRGKASSPSARIDIGAVEAPKYFVVTGGEFRVDGLQLAVRFTLNEAVAGPSVAPSDVVVERLTTILLPGGFIDATGVSVDGDTITFTLPSTMPYGPHKATLPAGSVADGEGNLLLVGLTINFTYLPPPSADFDSSGVVTGLDFLAWQRGFGSTGDIAATKANGNADHDQDVDADDFEVWKDQFGLTIFSATPNAYALVATDATPPLTPQAVDAALAWQVMQDDAEARPLFGARRLRAR